MKVEIVKDAEGYWPKVYQLEGDSYSHFIQEKGLFKKTYTLWATEQYRKKYCNVYSTREDALALLNRYYNHVKGSIPKVVYEAEW